MERSSLYLLYRLHAHLTLLPASRPHRTSGPLLPLLPVAQHPLAPPPVTLVLGLRRREQSESSGSEPQEVLGEILSSSSWPLNCGGVPVCTHVCRSVCTGVCTCRWVHTGMCIYSCTRVCCFPLTWSPRHRSEELGSTSNSLTSPVGFLRSHRRMCVTLCPVWVCNCRCL